MSSSRVFPSLIHINLFLLLTAELIGFPTVQYPSLLRKRTRSICFHHWSSQSKLRPTSQRSNFRLMKLGSLGLGDFGFNCFFDIYSAKVSFNWYFLYRMGALPDSGVRNIGLSGIVWKVPHLNWGRRRPSPQALSSLLFSVYICMLSFLYDLIGPFFLPAFSS